MLFTWDTTDLCIVFRGWRITGTGSLIVSLLAIVLLTAGYEAVREASRRYEAYAAKGGERRGGDDLRGECEYFVYYGHVVERVEVVVRRLVCSEYGFLALTSSFEATPAECSDFKTTKTNRAHYLDQDEVLAAPRSNRPRLSRGYSTRYRCFTRSSSCKFEEAGKLRNVQD
jgi:hypothetical protein